MSIEKRIEALSATPSRSRNGASRPPAISLIAILGATVAVILAGESQSLAQVKAAPASAEPTSYDCRAVVGEAKVFRRVLPSGKVMLAQGDWQSPYYLDKFNYTMFWSGAADDPFAGNINLVVKLPYKIDAEVREIGARIEIFTASNKELERPLFVTPFRKDPSAPYAASIPWRRIESLARTGNGLILKLVNKKGDVIAQDILSLEYIENIRKSSQEAQRVVIDNSNSPKRKCAPYFGAPDGSDIILT